MASRYTTVDVRLSYTSAPSFFEGGGGVRLVGFEPTTYGLEVIDESFYALLATRPDCSLKVLIQYRYVRFAGHFRQN